MYIIANSQILDYKGDVSHHYRMIVKRKRPKNLDLLKIRMPITAKVSILHRITGVLLFLSIPLLIYLLQLSLSDAQGYADAVAIVNGGVVKLFLFFLLWALLHHLLAGIRFLLIDIDVGVDINVARKSAKQTMIAAVVAAVIFGAIIL